MSEAHTALREPWQSIASQREAAIFGIWVFLVSEIMFFGAIFVTYAFLRTLHSAGFEAGSHETNVVYGTLNTGVLLTSSLTMVLAARAADIKAPRVALVCLALTAGLGLAFIVVKTFEYKEDIEKNLIPFSSAFPIHIEGARLFFALYWIVTLIHAFHLSLGIGAVARLVHSVARRSVPLRSPQYEVTALYWHLVDIVWIVLYPLLYLGGRAG